MQRRYFCLLIAAVVLVSQSVPGFAQLRRLRDTRVEGEKAVCVLQTVGKSGVTGTIFFEQTGNRIHVTGKISGLAPGKHGFHVHQYGDVTDLAKGESAGGHWNPHKTEHGAPDARTRHVGDLGNVEANSEGVAAVERTLFARHSIRGLATVLTGAVNLQDKERRNSWTSRCSRRFSNCSSEYMFSKRSAPPRNCVCSGPSRRAP